MKSSVAATEELIEFNPADNLGQRFSKPKKQNMPALPPLNSLVFWQH
jgi:hypothetical protein